MSCGQKTNLRDKWCGGKTEKCANRKLFGRAYMARVAGAQKACGWIFRRLFFVSFF
jgi:hypothetical protein